MCGISGIFDIKGIKSDDIDAIQRMLSYMNHRGPDDSGIEKFGSCVIGQKRLSIIDLTQNARQPFFDKGHKVALVVNGEIYNYLDLKKELESIGYSFTSSSDSEVILHGYIHWGEKVFKKLRGMFSIAIHDDRQKKIILARDRIGIKPLYYQIDENNKLVFSSEIGSLMSSNMTSRSINRNALYAYLFLGYSPQSMLLIDGIKSVEPGTIMTLDAGGVKKSKFWNMSEIAMNSIFSDQDLVLKVREILERSIQLHTQSDVPLGVFLSGGIDSTLIAGLLSKNHSKVKTLSVGFEDGDSKLNELRLASKTAEYFGTEHSEFVLSGQAVKERMPNIIRHMDSPTFDSINTFIVSEMAKKSGLTVALSGLGGDELFGGYPIYNSFSKYSNLIPVWNKMPRTIKELLISSMMLASNNGDRRNKLKRLSDVSNIDQLYSVARSNSWTTDIQSLFSSEKESLSKHSLANLFELFSQKDQDFNYWKYLQHNEIKNYVGWRLLRDTDSMSMAHSLEVRVPLLDDELLNFVLSLKPGWEKNLGWPKKLLIESTKDILPEHILNKEKQGFQLPMEVWIKNELRFYIDEIFSDSAIKKRGLFDPKSMKNLLNRFDSDQANYTEIWKFVVLELWMQEHNVSI